MTTDKPINRLGEEISDEEFAKLREMFLIHDQVRDQDLQEYLTERMEAGPGPASDDSPLDFND
jgi:hypothetical protein